MTDAVSSTRPRTPWHAARLVLGGTLLSAVLATTAGEALAARASTPAPVTITVSTDLSTPISGTNLLPWQDVWIPAFEKQYPSIHVNVFAASSSSVDQALYTRIVAAQQAHQAPPVNITDASILPQLAADGAGVKVTSAEVPLLYEVNPTLLQQADNEATPFRGSSVVIAYNSAKVKNPPKTLGELIAWIRHNPGEFTYCAPSTGGSGEGFVQDFANLSVPKSQDPTFELGYKAGYESEWTSGLRQLASLAHDMYRNGYYPDGNTAVLQLLANGSIEMAPVWSDGSQAAKADHLLPSTIDFTEIKPAPPGGPSDLMVLKGSPNQSASFDLVNFMLTRTEQLLVARYMHGYPGVEFRYAPAAIRDQFTGIESGYSPAWDAKYTNDLALEWQNMVPGTVGTATG